MNSEENFRKFVELRLGISDLEIELDNRAETQHATDMMVAQAQDSLEIFSRDLDAALYTRGPFLDAINALCYRNRKARIRFLVQEPVDAVRRSPRLVELSRKLSSSIEIRQPHPDYRHYNEAFLVADGCALIHRGLADRYEGCANFYAPVEAQRKLDFFNEVWERSEGHPEFRRLYL
ncbi:MAG: acyltransferase [Gammaproteobacteria bacterium]|jgi:hypothetical protein